MPIGAHVSAAGSVEKSFERALDIGAECTQIFISPPRQWAQTKHLEPEVLRYKDLASKTGLGPNFIHGTYLINLGTQDSQNLEKSIEWLIYALEMADKFGIAGVIFHLGSHKGLGFNEVLPQVVKAIKKILSGTQKSYLILENSAGAGNVLGDKFTELGQILKSVGSKRLKICMDTAHVFAAGYQINTKEGLDKTLSEFDKEIGLDNLVAIHANDSKVEFNSNRDRHANIGEGFIGKAGFTNLVNHPKLKDIPFLLEVPGFSGEGPDKKNVDILKGLRK